MSSKDKWPREKRWKDLYTRSVKLGRAQQLGIDYPRRTDAVLQRDSAGSNDAVLNVLFVCSRNQWRSPTAEHVFRNHPGRRSSPSSARILKEPRGSKPSFSIK